MSAALIRRLVPQRYRPIGYLTHLVRERTGGRVRLGPFAGMRYVSNSIASAYLPKLLGTYERELAHVLEFACARRPGLIVDIGAAEGYYAVGLALRNPTTRIIAFEELPEGRLALREMAILNRVKKQIQIQQRCEPANLSATLACEKNPLVICDVEGDEERLLNPGAVPELKCATILAEMHDFVHAGITEEIQRRFAATHKTERIWQQPRTHSDFPFRTIGTVLLPRSYLDWAVSEWRPVRMSWLWLQPYG